MGLAARRRILITADIGRALLFVLIPIAAWLGVLSLTQLSGVVLLVGVLTTFIDVAYQSFLPTLVRRDQLVSANSKLESSTALGKIQPWGTISREVMRPTLECSRTRLPELLYKFKGGRRSTPRARLTEARE